MGPLNTIIVRMPTLPWQNRMKASVTVTGFAPREISANNGYMEWCVPAGNYNITLKDQRKKHEVNCHLVTSDAVEIRLIPSLSYIVSFVVTALLWLSLSALTVYVLIWEFQHQRILFYLSVVALASLGWWLWQRNKSNFQIKVNNPSKASMG